MNVLPAWFTSRATTRLLAAAWATLLLLRGLLLDRGALSGYDERRYYQSLAAVQAIVHGHWREAAYALSMTAARPVDALWRCLPAAGQLAARRWLGWDVYAYPSLLLPTALNWLATVLAAWVFYRLCRQLLADTAAPQQWALVAAILYASLANTSLYVRHIIPYDGALLLLLVLLAWVLRWPAQAPAGRWLGLGVGAGLLWLLYPGYYAGPVLLVAAAADWAHPLRWLWRQLGGLVLLGLGFAAPLLAAEALSRLGGAPPFWAVSYDLSLHILQGLPAEGYTFLPEYLWVAEGPLGLGLLGLLAVAVGQGLWALVRSGWAAAVPQSPRQRVLLAAVLLFLAHATAAAVGHRIVWYGRLLHLYMPWLVLAGVAALAQLSSAGVAARLGVAATGMALVSYMLFFAAYQPLVYPPDVIAAYKLQCLPATQLQHYTEVQVPENFHFPVRPPLAGSCSPSASTGDSLTVLVNFSVLYPLTPATRRPTFAVPTRARILLQQPYFDSFPAYQFDGLGPAERAEMQRRKFKLLLLRIPAAPAKQEAALPLR